MNASPVASHTSLSRLFRPHLRGVLLGSLFLMLMAALPHVAHAATYTVTDTSDDVADTGSLRYALSQVNAGAGGDVINFSGVTGTITVGSTLNITEDVTINGPGANILAISGNDVVRVFSVASTAANTVISGLTITHGNATNATTINGAGIFAAGTLTVNNCTFSYNKAGFTALNVGAAIFSSAGTLTVNSSTFYSNQALVGNGGAINAGTLVVNDSTFYKNSAGAEGGAIWITLGTHLTLRNNTIVGNSATSVGGGVWITGDAPTVLANNIISGNTAVTNADYNCTVSCGTVPTGNLIGNATITSLLTPLQYNGGPTMTMAPLPGLTGVIGAGLNSTLATDQRGIPRPTSGASDIGAVQSYNLVVSTTADSTDTSALCDGSTGDTCSLRDALTLANAQGAGDIVTVTGLSGTIALNSPLPDDTADLNINGPGANQLTVSGPGSSTLFNITNPNAVTNLTGVTLTGGNGSAAGGGAIDNQGATLTLNNCEVNNNTAAGQAGGALNNGVSSTASVVDCTFSGNSADSGGAINNAGLLNVENSTFNGNTASATNGGAIFNQGSATVTTSTITGNTASALGGGIDNAGTITVSNSLVAGNTETGSPNDDCASCGTQTTFNLISTASAPVTAAQVMLAPLDYYGPNQTVRTMLPIPGSPVMQAGDPTQLPSDLTTDERQLPRTINSKLDLGAVESNYGSVQFVQQPTDTTVGAAISPSVSLSITESGVTAPNIPLTVSFTGNGNLDGTLTETTVAPANPGDPAVATFTGLNVDAAGTGDILNANVTVTPPAVSPAVTLTATSNPFDATQVTADVPVVSVGPSSPVYGQPETVSITVPTAGDVPPTGTVTVYNNGSPIGTGTLGPDGTVTVNVPGGTLPAGAGSITVGYAGDANYGSSTSPAVPITVAPVVSVPTLTVGPTSPIAGQPATVTVTVPTVGDTAASGSVTIYDNGNAIGTGTLGPDGTVAVNIPGGLPAGSNTITAGYAGAGNYGSSTSAPTAVTVTATSTPTVTIGPASPVYGQPETLTVTVPTVGSTPATGTVTIYYNGKPIGTGTLGPDGTVTVNIPGGILPAGAGTITVGYPGDSNYNSTTSLPAPITVAPVVSVPTLTVGPASPIAGQPATVTVAVPTVGSTAATGSVTIYDNGNPIGTGTLGANGTVTVNVPGGLPSGTNTITAGYAGAGNYAGATSEPTLVAVTALDFTLTRTSPASQTVVSGQVATIAVQVAPTYGMYPGVVSFTAAGLPPGATATFTPATVAADGGTAPVNLNIQTAPLLSANRLGGGIGTVALGLLLLPFAGKKRRQQLKNGRMAGSSILMVLVLLAGAVASVGLTGCVSGNGFFGHAPKTYTVTITATSGTIQHSVDATLNVQ